MRAESPDRSWVFEDGVLRSADAEVPAFAIDWFERWTFARFLPGGELALGFESGQPWSEYGSYGERRWGVQVLAPRSGSQWVLVAIEHDARRHDEQFVPDDVCWSPRGVLAWLYEGTLLAVVLKSPRGEIPPDDLPEPDSESDHVAYQIELPGRWRSLALDRSGRLLTATDDDGVDTFDLERVLRRRDDGEWQPFETWNWPQ
ncbi:MAG TPA: hypothetical protein VK034_14375 [Enhygromyxa sp.]|nr:hypothetical protein [Enhygromyxa sp.]